MAAVTVTAGDEGRFDVVVAEGASSTAHSVSVSPGTVARLAPGATADELVAASFRFLLDREPKESILHTFDLEVIGRYFPDYPQRIGDYL